MDKRKKIMIFCIIILLIFVLLGVKSCYNHTSPDDEINVDEYYVEKENSIVFESEKPITEIREKVIEITPFQKAQITINKNIQSGDLYIDIIENYTAEKKDSSTGIVEIGEGLGEYTIQIDSKNLVGSYDIEWNIESNDKGELYTSTKGYEIRYDSDKFQLKIEDGKEKFTFVEDENEVYFMVNVIESENIKEIKDNLVATSEATGKCKISEGKLDGIYTENKNDNMQKQNLIFELSENKMVVIEINKYYETDEINLTNEYIKNMIKTFKIK